MIVCVCKGVRCTKIRSLIADGVDSVEAIGEACGAGTDCGSCRCTIEDFIEEHRESASTPRVRLARYGAAAG
jgi:bacterioferritin-associated ferredoxin